MLFRVWKDKETTYKTGDRIVWPPTPISSSTISDLVADVLENEAGEIHYLVFGGKIVAEDEIIPRSSLA